MLYDDIIGFWEKYGDVVWGKKVDKLRVELLIKLTAFQ